MDVSHVKFVVEFSIVVVFRSGSVGSGFSRVGIAGF